MKSKTARPEAYASVLAERDRYKAAYEEFSNLTEWVQQTSKVGEFGRHRADVLRMRIEALQAEVMTLQASIASIHCMSHRVSFEVVRQECEHAVPKLRTIGPAKGRA